jgi:hypothetical protein
MKKPSELAKYFSSVIILLLINGYAWVDAAGFSVNGGGQQAGVVTGAAIGNDSVTASGTFARPSEN